MSKDSRVIRKIYTKQDKEEKKNILEIRDDFYKSVRTDLRNKDESMVTQKWERACGVKSVVWDLFKAFVYIVKK